MERKSGVRVLIVEDFPDLAMLYRQIISMQNDMELVDVVGSPTGLVQRVEESAPDVVVLDLHLAGELTADLVPRLASHAKIVVVSGRTEPELIHSLMAHGAAGYVPKTLTLADDLLSAIRTVADGRIYTHDPSPTTIGY